MDINQTYRYMMSSRWMSSLIRLKTIKRNMLQSRLLPKAITYDGDRVQTSPSDTMSEVAGEVLDMDKEIRRLTESKQRRIEERYTDIAQLKDEMERIVLAGYYLEELSMYDVADAVGYSYQHTCRIRKNGMTHLSELLHGKHWKDENNENFSDVK